MIDISHLQSTTRRSRLVLFSVFRFALLYRVSFYFFQIYFSSPPPQQQNTEACEGGWCVYMDSCEACLETCDHGVCPEPNESRRAAGVSGWF